MTTWHSYLNCHASQHFQCAYNTIRIWESSRSVKPWAQSKTLWSYDSTSLFQQQLLFLRFALRAFFHTFPLPTCTMRSFCAVLVAKVNFDFEQKRALFWKNHNDRKSEKTFLAFLPLARLLCRLPIDHNFHFSFLSPRTLSSLATSPSRIVRTLADK